MGSGYLPKALGLVAVACVIILSPTGSQMLDIDWTCSHALFWGILVLVVGSIAFATAKGKVQQRQKEENELVSDSSLPFVVLLRPFSADKNVLTSNPHRISNVLLPGNYSEDVDIPLARLLSQALKPDLYLRVIGGSPTGPGAIRATDSDWREKFKDRAQKAVGIIAIPLPGKEIPWELEELRRAGHLEKTVFLVPPLDIDRQGKVQVFLRDLWQKGFEIPFPTKKTMIVSLDSLGRVVNCLQFRRISYRNLRTVLSQKWGRGYFPVVSSKWTYFH